MGNSTSEPIQLTLPICSSTNKVIPSKGVFNGHNPLDYTAPLFMVQLSIASLTAILATALLKPLGFPAMISQIIGGIVMGPSVLGHISNFGPTMFPLRNFIVVDTFASFGIIFYLFLLGLQMDPWLIFKSGKKSLVIGTSVVIIPMMLSTTCATILTAVFHVDRHVSKSLLVVGVAESTLAFPVIAYFLSELNILNSEFSRVALSSSMVSGLICFSFMTILISTQTLHSKFFIVGLIFVAAFMMTIVVYILRPMVLWMTQQIPQGQTMKEGHLCAIFLTVLMLAYFGKQSGLHIFYGPFIFGLAIPSGPPLGTTLLERLDFLISWLIMPVFYAEYGMMLDISSLGLKNLAIVEGIILISCVGKFLGALLPSLYYNMSFDDAILLGLTVNVQGFLELSMFKLLNDTMLIDGESFQIMCASMLVTTGTFTPLARFLYKSSRKYVIHNRRTIEHSPPNTELRVLACIYDQENVPAIIHLLKASHPTKDSPISVSVIHLMELVGRATPMLISHKLNNGAATDRTTQRIISVFRRYEENNQETISLHPFTVISPYATMHNDVCMLALHKRACLIIIPFHKQLTTGITNSNARTVNCNILDSAPCSVGILIDRGLLGGFKFVLANWLSYNVVLIFLGGADDREALAYALRMSEHPSINLTIIQCLDTGTVTGNTEEKTLDDAAVNDFKMKTAYNSRVMYMEEEVINGTGVINVIESMENKFELIILGRRHDEESQLILGLAEWNKCTELGIMGHIFVSAEYGGKGTILIVQQQTNAAHSGNMLNDQGMEAYAQ